MLESLTFTEAKAQGTKFALGPIKNVWEVGPYGFIEFYITTNKLETQFLGFKEGKVVGKIQGTLDQAMRTALGGDADLIALRAGSTLLPFSRSLGVSC